MQLNNLKIKIFADGADLSKMQEIYNKGIVKGFTTNPTLMKKAGVDNYEEFAKKTLEKIPDLPISFEVFSDDFNDMEKQAEKINTWGENVNIKIPITNTKGESSIELINSLSNKGISLNVTAVFTIDQVKKIIKSINPKTNNNIISIFAGRIADAGIDPEPIMKEAFNILKAYPNIKLLWASSRELLNIFQAERCGCDIITITSDILNKIPSIGKNLDEFSLDTVKMFYKDAQAAGYKI